MCVRTRVCVYMCVHMCWEVLLGVGPKDPHFLGQHRG